MLLIVTTGVCVGDVLKNMTMISVVRWEQLALNRCDPTEENKKVWQFLSLVKKKGLPQQKKST